jgi:hypothetical protein
MAPNLAPSQHDLIHDMIVDEKLRTLRKEDCEPNQVSYNRIYGGWKAVGQIATEV